MNLLEELTEVLRDFTPYFAPILEDRNPKMEIPEKHNDFGNATFVRKSVAVTGSEIQFVYREPNSLTGKDISTIPRNILTIDIASRGSTFSVTNLHGAWQENTKKLDTPERIQQSQKILDFFATKSRPKILCGDFNLMPETESLLMLERFGLRNLIKEFHITDTRGALYEEPQRFADYVLASPEINVRSFSVPDIQISDHLPLILTK